MEENEKSVQERKCATCKYLQKQRQMLPNDVLGVQYGCFKKMIHAADIVTAEDLETTSCGYYDQRIDNEQLTLL